MTIRSLIGDCRTILPTLADGSVHCVVTSPPYFGLRDYGTATWQGGDSSCDHWQSAEFVNPKNTLGPNGYLPATNAANQMHQRQFREQCGKCGAIRIDSQIGLEPTPQAYVDQLVAVFREVRRVLRNDGTLWLNLGDSYGAVGGNTYAGFNQRWNGMGGEGSKQNATLNGVTDRTIDTGLRPKNLIGIPWRVAFALQADGWYLRQDIIWSKPNPMPESVTDRCTKAHEYIFLLSKNARYYYNAAAIAEPSCDPIGKGRGGSLWRPALGDGFIAANNHHGGTESLLSTGKRNKRSVWEIATQPFNEAHFATFPPALIEPCIMAGCPKGGTVLDPFAGAGTTGMVADRLGRSAVMIELNPAYAQLAEYRIRDDAGMFADII